MNIFPRPLPIRANENTQAQVQLVFSEDSTTPIPAGDEVAQVLKQATANNNTFAQLVDSTAITVISKYNQYFVAKFLIHTLKKLNKQNLKMTITTI